MLLPEVLQGCQQIKYDFISLLDRFWYFLNAEAIQNLNHGHSAGVGKGGG